MALPELVVTDTPTPLRLEVPRFGTSAVIVAPLTTVTPLAAMLLNLTVAPLIKLLPLIVTVAPGSAVSGEMPLIVGGTT